MESIKISKSIDTERISKAIFMYNSNFENYFLYWSIKMLLLTIWKNVQKLKIEKIISLNKNISSAIYNVQCLTKMYIKISKSTYDYATPSL